MPLIAAGIGLRFQARENFARLAVRLCQRFFKVQIPYQDRADGPTIDVWFGRENIERSYGSDGALGEERTRMKFYIPRQYKELYACPGEQPVFPPEYLPSTGCQIIYEGKNWTASLNEKWETDSVGAVYSIVMESHQPRRTQG